MKQIEFNSVASMQGTHHMLHEQLQLISLTFKNPSFTNIYAYSYQHLQPRILLIDPCKAMKCKRLKQKVCTLDIVTANGGTGSFGREPW